MPTSPFDSNFDPKGEGATQNPGASQDGTPKVIPTKSHAASVQGSTSAPPLRKQGDPVKVVKEEVEALPVAPAPAAAPVALSADAISTLLGYLIAKEGRVAQKDQEDLDRLKHIQAQRNRNAAEQDSKTLLKQARCKHLKGHNRAGNKRVGPKTQNTDYAVYQHRFIAFITYIRCRICGMKWFPEDTTTTLTRLDKHNVLRKISNHTAIGWREAYNMVEQSTDTASASESIPNIAPNATNIDKYGKQFETRLVDQETGEMVEGVTI